MYYYVYQIINLVNGKIYVGKHKSAKAPHENGYYGSGKQITAAIKKYGVDNFKKEVLYYCSSLDEMSEREAEIVTEDFVKRSDTYNMHKGGPGGWDHYNGSEAHRRNSSKGGVITGTRASNPFNNPEWQKKFNSMNNPDIVKFISARGNSPIAIAKKKETFKKINHQKGEKNSQFGTCWVTHSELGNKKISKDDLDKFLTLGYTKGRKIIAV